MDGTYREYGCAPSLLLHKAFWARHFAPVFPFYVALLGMALAGGASSRHRGVRLMPFLLVGLLLFSALNFRFAPSWRKEDYRAAAQYARQALTENKSVWWLAAQDCARYYHLELGGSDLQTGKAFLPYMYGMENVPLPDVIVYSKPDIYDPAGGVLKLIDQNHYGVAVRYKSFVICTNTVLARSTTSIFPH